MGLISGLISILLVAGCETTATKGTTATASCPLSPSELATGREQAEAGNAQAQFQLAEWYESLNMRPCFPKDHLELAAQWVGQWLGRTDNWGTEVTMDVSAVYDEGFYMADYRYFSSSSGCTAVLRIKEEGKIYRFEKVKGNCQMRKGKFRLKDSKLAGRFSSASQPVTATFSRRGNLQ